MSASTNKIMLSIFASIFVIGCNLQNKTLDKSSAIVKDLQGAKDENPAIIFEAADKNCQNSSSRVNLLSQGLWQWQNNSTSNFSANLNFASSDPVSGLHSEQTISALINFHQVNPYTCSDLNGSWSCKAETAELANEGTGIKICNQTFNYSRTSLESIALSAVNTITKSANFFIANAGDLVIPKPIVALIHPKIDSLYKAANTSTSQKIITHSTDNAAYTQLNVNDKKYGAILLYPTSQNSLKGLPQQVLGLWESEYITAHEYGHHLFGSLAPSIDQFTQSVVLDNNKTEVEQRLNKSMPPKSQPRMAAAPENRVKTSDVGAIFGEAYADFFATHLTNNPESMKIAQHICNNRNNTINYFEYNNKKITKQITQDVSDIWLGNKTAPTVYVDAKNCVSISYTDPHILGAIVSYTLNALTLASDNKSIHAASVWVKELEQVFASGGAPKQILEQGTILMAKVFAAQNASQKLNAKQCEIYKNSFPLPEYATTFCQ